MAKKKELKEQSIDELKAMATQLDREIFHLRNELSTQRKLEKPHQIKEKRKEKARVLTIMTQKQRGIG
jgi:large subunit ribosomal protein L29